MFIKRSFDIDGHSDGNLNCCQENDRAQIVPVAGVLVKLKVYTEPLRLSKILNLINVFTVRKFELFLVQIFEN